MNNFKAIYRILKYLESAMDQDEPDMDFLSAKHLNLTEQRWAHLMEMLAEEGWVKGVGVKRAVSGEIIVSLSNVRITAKGLQYLEENSMMKKAENLAKGIAGFIP